MQIDNILKHRFRGMGRLRSFLRGPYPVTLVRAKTKDGVTLALDPESYLDWFIIQEGYYEREVLEAITSCLGSDGVFWDVGANCGLHSLTVKHLRPEVTVIAFEPVPFMAARIMINAELNGLQIDVMALALGSASGYSKIAIKLRGNSGLSSLSPWPELFYEANATCRVERGDALVDSGSVPPPTVIKVDVEGYEPHVFAGLGALLRTEQLRAVVFESDGAHLEQIRALMVANGFTVHPLRPENAAESGHRTPNYLAKR
jgi:FkbM family methyltransferase